MKLKNILNDDVAFRRIKEYIACFGWGELIVYNRDKEEVFYKRKDGEILYRWINNGEKQNDKCTNKGGR